MGLRIGVCTFISIIFFVIAILTFLVYSIIFGEITILCLGVPLAFSIFMFSLLVFHRNNKEKSFKIMLAPISKIFLYILTISSMLVVLFVPTFNGSMLEWMTILPQNWIRYIFSLLLTSFLPGYFFLRILDRKGMVSGGIVLVLSYLLSLFITFFVGFFLLVSGNSIDTLAVPTIVAINLVLVAVHFFANLKKDKSHTLTLNWSELALILSVLIVVTLGSIFIMVRNLPLTPGDMQVHYGIALEYDWGFPIFGGKLVTYSGGYLFNIYLAVLFVLSGIPSALALQGLYILSFMPILAFYSTVKIWFDRNEDKKIASKVAMLSLLLGFGGLYALYLKFANPTYDINSLLSIATSKTDDIYMRVLYLPDIVSPLWNIGLPVFFTLLYFIKKEGPSLTNAAMITLLVAQGYLGHTPDVIIFAFILFLYTLFFRRRGERKAGPLVLLGLGVVLLVDLVAPARLYTSLSFGNGSNASPPAFLIPVFLAALTSVLEFASDRLEFRFWAKIKIGRLKLEKTWRYSRWILVYAYVFFLVIWLAILKDFDIWEWGGYSFTPFFVLPLRLGVVGLLALVSVFIYLAKIIKDKRLLFFFSFIPLGFILEQTGNLYSVFYPSYRYATLIFIGACVIAAYGITKLLERKSSFSSTMRAIIAYGFIFILIIYSSLTTVLYYVSASYYSNNWNMTQEEEGALRYIHQNLAMNESVLAFSEETSTRLRNFAGLNAVQDAQRWSNHLLSASNPFVMTYVLSSSNVRFVYVAQRDVTLLKSNSIMCSLVEYLPKSFENEYVTVYEVPILTPASKEASVCVLDFSPSIRGSNTTSWIDVSFDKGWLPNGQSGAIRNYESKVGNGSLKISVTSNQSGNVWISYALSGLSLNTSIYSILSFNYRVENTHTWFTLQLWNSKNEVFFYVGHLADEIFMTKSYLLPDNQAIAKIEIIVETTADSPEGTSAVADISAIEVSRSPFSKESVFPALFTSLLGSNYSLLYVDDFVMQKLEQYTSNYTRIILTSDPPTSVNGLFNWVSAGKTLMVFNTYGNGFFSSLLGLNNQTSGLSICNFGLGKILYLNSISSNETEIKTELLQPYVLERVKEAMELENYKHTINVLPVYNSTFGGIEIKGDLKIHTDTMVLQGPTSFIGSPFPTNESTEVKIYGEISLTIKNASLLISPSEAYLIAKPELYPVEGEVEVNGSVTLEIADKNVTYVHDMPVSFKFKTANMSLYARKPSISAQGTIIFDQLDVHSALYVPLAGIVQQRAEILGSVKFDTMYINSPLIMFSTFQADGEVENLAQATAMTTLPWAEILSSPYNLAFNTVFVSSIVMYALMKRKTKKPKVEQER